MARALRLIGYSAFTLTAALAIVVLAIEGSPPLTAAKFMIELRMIDWRVVGMMTPFAIGFCATAFALVRAVFDLRRGLTQIAWLWLFVAVLVAPLLAVGGNRLAARFLALPNPAASSRTS